MERSIIITICLKKTIEGQFFHFNGVWKGQKIKSLVYKGDLIFKERDEYILDVNLKSLHLGILEIEIARFRNINQIKFNF